MSANFRSRLSKNITVVINQPAGLGDLIWIQAIIQDIRRLGASVIIPVINLYFNEVSERLSSPGVTYLHEDDTFPFKDVFKTERNPLQEGNHIYLPLTHSHLAFPDAPLMISKYLMAGTELTDYRESVKIKRDFYKEAYLWDMLELKEGYLLINDRYGTFPKSLRRSINPCSSLRKVRVEPYEGVSLFDWIPVIQNATEIHSVETSICYLVDIYSRESQKKTMYGKRLESERPNFFKNTALVYRSSNWVYKP